MGISNAKASDKLLCPKRQPQSANPKQCSVSHDLQASPNRAKFKTQHPNLLPKTAIMAFSDQNTG